MYRPLLIPETNVLAYLKSLGVDPKNFPQIMKWGHLDRIHWGTLTKLRDEVSDDFSKINRCTLPQILESGPEEFDPSPQYDADSRRLTYEILSWAKYRRQYEQDIDYCIERFTKGQIERLKYLVNMARGSNHLKQEDLTAEDMQILDYGTRIGLFIGTNRGYEPNWLDMSVASVVVYSDRRYIRPDEVKSLADIQKLSVH